MKTCNRYSRQSSVCNSRTEGACPMRQVEDINQAADPTDPNGRRVLEFRCLRKPYLGKEPNYVKHI